MSGASSRKLKRFPACPRAFATAGPLLALALAGAGFFLAGCPTHPGNHSHTVPVEFTFHHMVDDQELRFDTLMYTNAAGNRYRVTRLEYYVSDFTFLGHENEVTARLDTVLYVNPRDSATLVQRVSGLKEGHHHGLKFTFGLRPEINVQRFLAPTLDNLNMFWPEQWGGGYHFMRLEGNYLDTAGEEGAFATHLGSRGHEGQLNHFDIEPAMVHRDIQEGMVLHVPVTVNLNKWYEDPHTYDFNTHPGAIMNNGEEQIIFRENGSKGVFKVGEAKVSLDGMEVEGHGH